MIDAARRRIGLAWLVLALPVTDLAAQTNQPTTPRLRTHVETLASPEYGGRRGPGARKAEAYVTAAFREIGLEPLFGGRFTQDILGPDGLAYGRNVGGLLKPVGDGPVEEWIVVGAHYDHLGQKGETIYPGADDNASGVAMLIEVARSLKARAPDIRRGVMFVAFDLEEDGLLGSKFFVDHPPVPLESIKLNLTADMIGRSLGGVCEPYVFVLGSESAPKVRPWIKTATPGERVKVGLLGADLLGIPRSDYGPFKAKKIPYLFFSTGENPCYHKPEDVPDTIDYAKLTAVSILIADLLREALSADSLPGWVDTPEHSPDEPKLLREVIQTLVDHRGQLKIGNLPLAMMRSTLKTLDEAIARGGLSDDERNRLVRTAQVILISVL